LLGTRVALLGEDQPWIEPFLVRLFRANFVDDAPIDREDVVRAALDGLVDRPDDLIAQASAPETKEALKARTREALDRGVFGAPTLFVGDEMYWGDDRLEDALAAAGSSLSLISCVSRDAARAFAERWLPAWTGDDPERLVSFYADDALYLDPVVPTGLRGREALLGYFRRLLRRNPAWVWTQREAIPMERGFVNLWHASIPREGRTVEVDGVCLVELRGDRIVRNEVYFDPAVLSDPGGAAELMASRSVK
jgi:ketosteroid isomerase-like protein